MYADLDREYLSSIARPLAHAPFDGSMLRSVAIAKDSGAMHGPLSHIRHLLPASLVNAVPERQYEFLVGRAAAAVLLREQGLESSSCWIGRDGRRPIWPPGIAGTISHSDTLVWVLVSAHAGRSMGLGCDVEALDQPEETLQAINLCLTPAERNLLGDAVPLPIAFAAKEALFKCIHPLSGIFFSFLDAEIVHFGPAQILMRLARNIPPFGAGSTLQVKYETWLGHVWTLATCTRPEELDGECASPERMPLVKLSLETALARASRLS